MTNEMNKDRRYEAVQLQEWISAIRGWKSANQKFKEAERRVQECRRSAEYLRQRYDRAATRGRTAEAKTFARRYDRALSELKTAKAELSHLKEEATKRMDRLSDAFDNLPDNTRSQILETLRSNTRSAGEA
jgi:chromosome segregation ATPase